MAEETKPDAKQTLEDRLWKLLPFAAMILVMVAINRGWITPEQADKINQAIPLVMAKAPEPEQARTETVTTVTASAPVGAIDSNQLLNQVQQWIAVWQQVKPIWEEIRPIVQPVPVPPIVVPVVPDPVKPVVPDGSTKIVITDELGKPISAATVEHGVLFRASSTGATANSGWSLSRSGDVKVITLDGNAGFVCYLNPGAWVEFHLTDFTTRTQLTQRITCNQGGQPPPVTPDTPVTPPVVVNPVVPPSPPQPTTTGFSELIAKEAEVANVSPAFLASEVVDGILKFAIQDGMPTATADAIRAAVPAIGQLPARDLTADEVAKIRGVK